MFICCILYNLQTSDCALDGTTSKLEGLGITDKRFGPVVSDHDVETFAHKKWVKIVSLKIHFFTKIFK